VITDTQARGLKNLYCASPLEVSAVDLLGGAICRSAQLSNLRSNTRGGKLNGFKFTCEHGKVRLS